MSPAAGARRRVLVTGAGSGIGLATSLLLARSGFDVVGLVPDDEGRAALDGAASDAGAEVATVVADLSQPRQRRGVAAGLGLWGLVNNAGYMNAGQVQDVSIDEARQQLEAMVLAPMDLALQVLPGMLAQGEGRVINLSTGAVHFSTPLTGWYQASKAALRELTDALRVELRGTGVMVMDVEPGGYKTGIWDRGRAELDRRSKQSRRPELYRMVLENLEKYQRHMGDPEDVANAIFKMLTRAHPPVHRRLGPGTRFARVVSEVVPDRLWDSVVGRVTSRA